MTLERYSSQPTQDSVLVRLLNRARRLVVREDTERELLKFACAKILNDIGSDGVYSIPEWGSPRRFDVRLSGTDGKNYSARLSIDESVRNVNVALVALREWTGTQETEAFELQVEAPLRANRPLRWRTIYSYLEKRSRTKDRFWVNFPEHERREFLQNLVNAVVNKQRTEEEYLKEKEYKAYRVGWVRNLSDEERSLFTLP